MDFDQPLKPVPPEQQNFSLWDTCTIWTGISICLPSFMVGGLLVPDLSFMWASIVLVLGNGLIALFTYIMGLPGIKHGYSSALLIRRLYGKHWGALIPSLVVVIAMTGWSAVMLGIAGDGIHSILISVGAAINPTWVVVLTGLLVTLCSLFGKDVIRLTEILQTPILAGLCCWIIFILADTHQLGQLIYYQPPSNHMSVIQGLLLVIGGSVAGIFVSSDWSRFSKSRVAYFGGAFMGIIPASVLLGIIGIISQLAAGSWNPVEIVKSLGMGIPALLLIVFSTWTTNQATIYSGGLAMANLLPWSRKISTFALGIAATIIAAGGAARHLTEWLTFLNYLFIPMIVITIILWLIGQNGRGRDSSHLRNHTG